MLASGPAAVVLTRLPAVIDAAGQAKKGSSVPGIVLVVVAALGVLFVLSRGRRRARLVQSQQAELTVGSTVVTRSGVIGTLVEQGDEEFVLEVAPGVRMRWMAGALSQVRPPADPAEAPPDPADERRADGSAPTDDGRLAD